MIRLGWLVLFNFILSLQFGKTTIKVMYNRKRDLFIFIWMNALFWIDQNKDQKTFRLDSNIRFDYRRLALLILFFYSSRCSILWYIIILTSHCLRQNCRERTLNEVRFYCQFKFSYQWSFTCTSHIRNTLPVCTNRCYIMLIIVALCTIFIFTSQ